MKANRIQWLSVLQFGLSALAVFILWSGSLLIITIAISSVIAGKAGQSVFGNPLRLFTMAAVYAAIGILTLPSAFFALWHVLDLPAINLQPSLNRFKPAVWIVFFPLVLLTGYWITNIPVVAYVFFPLMHLLAVSLPIIWILNISIRSVPLGSPQRMWGVFTSGLLLAPLMAMVLEGVAGIAFLLVSVLYISRDPALMNQLTKILDWVRLTNPTPELLFERITPLLVHPVAILSTLLLGAIVVPLIEEALKPIGVWFLARNRLSPSEGFVLGAISGAAYATVESLVLTGDGQQWISMMVARVGTAVVHIFTSGLVGWALVQARNKRGYALLGISYLASVTIHGTWNALTLFSTFSFLATLNGMQLPYDFIYNLGFSAPFGLIFLVIGIFITLLNANRLLGHSDSRRIQIS